MYRFLSLCVLHRSEPVVEGIMKCSKILNTFLFLLSNKILVFRAVFHKMFDRIANREYPDQTASSEAV